MKHLILIITLTISFCCCHDRMGDNKSRTEFYVGTYTGSGSQGIYKYLMYDDGTLEQVGLAVKTENPSYLAFNENRKFLLAVNENSPEGTIETYRLEGDSLIRISRSKTGGAHPCFVAINEHAYVLTANYSSGTIGLLKLSDNGQLSGLLDVQQHTGSGMTDRQRGPHAHSAWFEPGTSRVISADLGTNEVWFSYLDTVQEKLCPENPQRLRMDPGAGPRHMAFHPDGKWIYVINELNSTVTLVKENASEEYEKGPSFKCLPADYESPNYCADIGITSDGRFVYASNRGHNSIAIFKTNEDTGILESVGHQTTCGDWPRNLKLSPDENYLLVANQNSNNIVSFKRDITTGYIEPVDTIKAPSPVCILFR